MKKILFWGVLSVIPLSMLALSPREELKIDPNRSASFYYAYPTPQGSLSPAPKGKKAFYISHYGRHGSRHLIDSMDYIKPLTLLKKASKEKVLTAQGERLLKGLELLYQGSLMRYGELTELGAEQHRQIARRMYKHFPEVFKGEVCVEAKSSVVIRCILSMENELQELSSLNPKLKIRHDASEHDIYYLMNFTSDTLKAQLFNDSIRSFFKEWEERNIRPERFMESIISNSAWREKHVEDSKKLFLTIFDLAGIIQNSELRHQISFYPLFTEEELYALWKRYNLNTLTYYGPCAWNGGKQPYSQCNLLRKIVEEADSCLLLPAPGASLRFGHESLAAPLFALININGLGNPIHYTDIEEKHWIDYQIIPMACNMQLVFYRKDLNDTDIWVKVLLNEKEATLPVPPVCGPYYRWRDVRKYCLDKIERYEKSIQ